MKVFKPGYRLTLTVYFCTCFHRFCIFSLYQPRKQIQKNKKTKSLLWRQEQNPYTRPRTNPIIKSQISIVYLKTNLSERILHFLKMYKETIFSSSKQPEKVVTSLHLTLIQWDPGSLVKQTWKLKILGRFQSNENIKLDVNHMAPYESRLSTS